MQRYLISYKFYDGNSQEKGGEMLVDWYEGGGPQNRPDGYEVHSWIFMHQLSLLNLHMAEYLYP